MCKLRRQVVPPYPLRSELPLCLHMCLKRRRHLLGAFPLTLANARRRFLKLMAPLGVPIPAFHRLAHKVGRIFLYLPFNLLLPRHARQLLAQQSL